MGQKTRRFNDDADILREVCFLTYFHMVDINLTLIWAEKAADALHKYRLAGTVVAHDAVNLSLAVLSGEGATESGFTATHRAPGSITDRSRPVKATC